MAKKIINLLIVVVVVFTAGFFASRYWYSDSDLFSMFKKFMSTVRNADEAPESTESEEAMVVEPEEEETPETEEDIVMALKYAFSAKYDKPASDVNLSIDTIEGDYAKGLVKFAGEISGGWFLAVREESKVWSLVADGNGTVMCSDIEGYEFPVAMVSECWDDGSQSLVTL